jgi:tetratricopeptide (TPR) repeat protein
MFARLLGAMGRFEEAIASAKRAQLLDPLSLPISTGVGFQLYLARRYDEAIKQHLTTVAMDGNFLAAHLNLGQVYLQAGDFARGMVELKAGSTETDGGGMAELVRAYALAGKMEEASALLEKLKQLSERRYVSPYFRAVASASFVRQGEVIGWLQKGFEDRSWPMIFLNVDPRFDRFRGASEFRHLVEQMRFPPNSSQAGAR